MLSEGDIGMSHVRSALAGLTFLASIGLASGSNAQNYDGSTQVRFGAFGLGFANTAHVFEDGVDKGSRNMGRYGAGIVGGIDWVGRGYLLGIEGDIAATSANAIIGGDKFGQNFVATIRGRVGVYVQPKWSVFLSGGVAATAVSFHDNSVVTSNPGAVTAKFSHTQLGLTGGVGTEYAITRSILLFGEYLYADAGQFKQFAQPANSLGVPTGAPHNWNIKYEGEHLFRLGVKFKVGHDYEYHDDVAERIGRRRD